MLPQRARNGQRRLALAAPAGRTQTARRQRIAEHPAALRIEARLFCHFRKSRPVAGPCAAVLTWSSRFRCFGLLPSPGSSCGHCASAARCTRSSPRSLPGERPASPSSCRRATRQRISAVASPLWPPKPIRRCASWWSTTNRPMRRPRSQLRSRRAMADFACCMPLPCRPAGSANLTPARSAQCRLRRRMAVLPGCRRAGRTHASRQRSRRSRPPLC